MMKIVGFIIGGITTCLGYVIIQLQPKVIPQILWAYRHTILNEGIHPYSNIGIFVIVVDIITMAIMLFLLARSKK